MTNTIKKISLLATGFMMLAGGFAATSDTAEAKLCRRVECAARAPFVCKGPIGSCGFQQGACIRHKVVHWTVRPWRSCSGSPLVVR